MIDLAALVEQRIDAIWTQYRESPNMLFFVRTLLDKIAEVAGVIDAIPEEFQIHSATGEQLTWVGKRLGWPRCHCVCVVQPVFGFECAGVTPLQPLTGFCDDNSTWAGCGEFGLGEVCIFDDETYRKFLIVRRRQFLGLFDTESLEAALIELFGETARLLDAGESRIVIAPGRELTDSEQSFLQLYPRVLPVAPGIETRFHFGSTAVFGFGNGWGGFCEDWFPDGAILGTELGEELATEAWVPIGTGPLTNDAPWMCEIDVKPYSC